MTHSYTRLPFFLVLALVSGCSSSIQVPVPQEKSEPANVAVDEPNWKEPVCIEKYVLQQEKTQRADLYGDPLPAGAIARLGSLRLRPIVFGHRVGFSPDSKIVASTSWGGVDLWDVATGQRLRHLGGEQFSFSGDGKTVAVIAGRNSVHLCDAKTGKVVRQCNGDGETLGEVALSPDGRTVVAANYTKIFVWDTATGKQRFELAPGEDVRCVVFSPDGRVLASATIRGDIRMWDIASGKQVRKLTGGGDIAFSPDGKMLAIGGGCQPLWIWDIAKDELVRQLDEHQWGFTAYSPDGTTVAFNKGGEAGSVLREVATGKDRLKVQGHGVVFSPDGKTLAYMSGCHSISLCDAKTGKELHHFVGHSDSIYALTFSPDGRFLVTGGRDSMIGLWEPLIGALLRKLSGPQHMIRSVAVSPDSKVVASSDGAGVHLWEAATGKQLPGGPQGGGSGFVAFSPDGQSLVLPGDDEQSISFWDRVRRRKRRQLSMPEGQRQAGTDSMPYRWRSPFLSPDARTLLSIKEPIMGRREPWVSKETEGCICQWDLSTGRVLRRFGPVPGEHDKGVGAAALSPDGRLLASANSDGHIWLWEVATGKPIWRTSYTTTDYSHMSMAFSGDSRLLAWGVLHDNTVHLLAVTSGKEIGQLKGHRNWVQCVAFSPTSNHLASGDDEGIVLVWNLRLRTRVERKQFSAKDLEAFWTDMLGEDSSKAYQSVWTLMVVPEQSVAFLKERLPPTAPFDPKRMAQLLDDLDSSQFSTREKASEELEGLGELAEPDLRRVLAGKPSLEMRRRLEKLLEKLSSATVSPERLRTLRALAVLEGANTPQAKQVLDELAKGVPEAWLTQEAKAALNRLAKRLAATP